MIVALRQVVECLLRLGWAGAIQGRLPGVDPSLIGKGNETCPNGASQAGAAHDFKWIIAGKIVRVSNPGAGIGSATNATSGVVR